MLRMTTDYRQNCQKWCCGVGTRGNGVPTPLCTSNFTWRFIFFISIFACRAWSSINEKMTHYLVYSTLALKWNRKTQCGNSCRWISPLWLVCELRSHSSFLRNKPLPANNNFWTKVQLSTKSDAFLSTNILLSLIIFCRSIVQYF